MTSTNRWPGRDHTSRTYPVVPPIYQTTTFELDDTSYADIQGTGGLRETWYSRFNNPTVDAAATEVARRHGAARSLMTASGMAAIATTLVTLLRSGDTVVASKQVYGDTDDLFKRDLPALGITVVRVDAFDTDGWNAPSPSTGRRSCTAKRCPTAAAPHDELVPSLVDFRWRSTAILGGGTDSFGGSGGAGMGVSA